TLKGSGRMVGAQMIGEFAWSIENLLNRVINQTLEPTPAMIAFIQEAADVFPQLIEQLEVGIPPRADIQLLMKRAEAFAQGDPDAERLSGDSLRLPGPDETEAPAAAAADDAAPVEPEMDPVLADIFVKETLGHLETLRSFVESARSGTAPHTVSEPLYRACHTLHGSAKMAAYAPAVALVEPLSDHIGRLYHAGRGLLDEGIATLAAAADEIARMTDALTNRTAFAPDPDVVARLERLEQSAAPEQRAAQADTSSPELEQSFDPEIAAIFMEEAAEILENAERALDSLRREGEGSASIVELQRLLHTLKGGARMAGITTMGNLSHALETLLAGMAERRVVPTAETLDLLQQCLDTLHTMRDCVEGGRPLPASGDLVARI